MKKIKKGDEPPFLTEYKKSYPDDDWKNGFKKNAGKEPNAQVKEYLTKDQKRLCLYCEIDLLSGKGYAIDDFRVEHFFPENPQDNEEDVINHALEWSNLFGCCCGGNQPSVVDKDNRYTNPDFSCDVDKGNNNWVDLILNPLNEVPAFPLIFDYDEDGYISVSENNCPEDLKAKAENSIRLLKLNSERLIKFREKVITKLRSQLIESIEKLEMSDNDALYELAETYLKESPEYPAFFSLIRWYLTEQAEIYLKEIEYDG
ncbi:retron Ec78 anti-phage system effector HNH endonuclease PtuB [Aliivibrio fischeri]|uniref:retron Ec78 anti-phage system effector HNH endonuclease PtuB n=1 Tax=Aliivibrio fischeri TaxID=668 RepID=UPI001F3FE96C|nr:retron Ec78 anti-phage system effector HNH endonuclease PtuB [Aliivibrio fischeri]MCE7553615.1 TIGR02646 family protein [Aliivibrio fischeri]MCE7561533.1 TIGR02646 family protein [Aliivibrio fischeri]MCE7568941.1 TIGR02646 family protein [Aliivibrio fischeri]